MYHYSQQTLYAFGILLFFAGYFLWYLFGFIYRVFHPTLLRKNRTLKKLKRLSWDDFERLCVELFEREGWHAKGNEKKGADGGVDIWIERRGVIGTTQKAIVQCKKYEDSFVGIKVVREMYGLMYEYEVDCVYIVTTSRFSKECYKFIENKEIFLINGEELVALICK